MTFICKLCILTIVAYVHASPRLSRAEGEAGSMWSKFLGKVPDYFAEAESSELQTSDEVAASANSAIQNDEVANDGGSSYPNPSQISENKWQEQFKKCMESYGQGASGSSGGSGGSSSGGSQSSNQYGSQSSNEHGNHLSSFSGSHDSFKKQFEKCRSEINSSFGQYPGAGGGQDFFNQYKPQMPSDFGSYTSAFGSSPSSDSSASA